MSTFKKLLAVALAIVIILAAIGYGASSKGGVLSTGAGFPSHNTPEVYSQGLDLGDGYVEFSKGGLIGPGANQGSWRNTTGRTIYVDPKNTAIGFSSGTASTSLRYYVATSSSATFSSDIAAPSSVLAVAGSVVATSTVGPSFVTGTSTALGTGIPVTDGQYLVFQVQSVNYAVAEAATSTNRGITNFFWRFKGFYQP